VKFDRGEIIHRLIRLLIIILSIYSLAFLAVMVWQELWIFLALAAFGLVWYYVAIPIYGFTFAKLFARLNRRAYRLWRGRGKTRTSYPITDIEMLLYLAFAFLTSAIALLIVLPIAYVIIDLFR